MIKIWGRPNSINVQKVMWTVGEIGLEHERIDAGGAFGGLDSEDYAKLNPNRLIPAVVDGEIVVWESNACVRYLAAKYGKADFYPGSVEVRAHADMWMDWQAMTVNPRLGVVFWGLIRTPVEKRDMNAINEAANRVAEMWKRLDRWLSDRTFVAGDEFTMGDIPVGAAFYRYNELPITRPHLANCERWYQTLKSRGAYRQHVMIPLT